MRELKSNDFLNSIDICGVGGEVLILLACNLKYECHISGGLVALVCIPHGMRELKLDKNKALSLGTLRGAEVEISGKRILGIPGILFSLF